MALLRADPRTALATRRLGAAVAAFVLALFAAAAVRAQPTLEYAVKANYLYRFTPFVEWPRRAFASPADPFNICVVGHDPFGRSLDEAVRGKLVAEHAIAVRRLSVAEKGMNCHLMFAGRSKSQSLGQMLLAVAGQPVLTVADAGAGAQGAMIRFVLQQGRVRFDIDAAAAAANGLEISSKLQSLAVSRREGAP
jgi:hypothetical protein